MEIIRELREGEFDVLVGINLLREGLDLPEVSLVAILDADKEGFLRSTRSLIQTIGRAARNVNGTRDPLRRPRDRLDPRRRSPRPNRRREIQEALQPRARHHAADGEQAHREPARLDLGAGLRDGADAATRAMQASVRSHELPGADRRPAPRDARGSAGARVRAGRRAARPDPGARGGAPAGSADVALAERDRGAARRARRLPVQERARGGPLRRQGAEPARARAPVLRRRRRPRPASRSSLDRARRRRRAS